MDWAVTARTTVPHVREVDADRELTTWLLVDATPEHGLRHRRAGEARAGGGGDGRGRLPHRRRRQPARRPRAARRRAAPLPGPHRPRCTCSGCSGRCSTVPRGTAGRRARLARRRRSRALHRAATRRGLVVVVSDFLDGLPDDDGIDAAPDWERALRRLAARHQVLAVEVTDPRELELPDVGADHARRPGDRRPARGLDRRPPAAGAVRRGGRASSGRPCGGAAPGRCGTPAAADRPRLGAPTSCGTCMAQRRLAAAAPARPRRGRRSA